MNKVRIYHAVLATLAVLAYVTGELGVIHAWLGYGVAVVIICRLLWALKGERQVGLTHFYPSFGGLRLGNAFSHPAISRTLILGIAVCLIAVTATGIMMDKGRTVGFMTTGEILRDDSAHKSSSERDSNDEEGYMTEVHEVVANLLLLFVGMHVAYLFVFKRPLVLFMLFVPKRNKKNDNP